MSLADDLAALQADLAAANALNTASKAAAIDGLQARLAAHVAALKVDLATPTPPPPGATKDELDAWLADITAQVAILQQQPAPPTPPTPPATLPTILPAGGIFTGPNSVWNKDISSAPLASNSAAVVANLVSQIGKGPVGTDQAQWSTPVYIVDDTTPLVVPAFNTSLGWSESANSSAARKAGIRIPPNAVPSPDSDSEMAIWCPPDDTLSEFWGIKKSGSGWVANQTGTVRNASTSPGIFGVLSGAAATNLPRTGGLIEIAAIEAGVISHALVIGIEVESSQFSYPAQHTDGASSDPNMPMEGQRFRLDPSIDLSSLGLSAVGLIVARALQTFGAIIVDHSGAVNFYAEPESASGSKFWDTHPIDLTGIPWSSLQALPKDWGKPS